MTHENLCEIRHTRESPHSRKIDGNQESEMRYFVCMNNFLIRNEVYGLTLSDVPEHNDAWHFDQYARFTVLSRFHIWSKQTNIKIHLILNFFK